jgi:zinc protease
LIVCIVVQRLVGVIEGVSVQRLVRIIEGVGVQSLVRVIERVGVQSLVCILIGLGAPSLARAQFAPDQTVPLDSAVTVARLPNGLRYAIRVNREPRQRAELRLVVNVGSVLENDDQLGLAHFVEHMAFNGTRDFAADKLVAYLQSLGMRFGADVNAFTSFDQTLYLLTVPTDDDSAFTTAFRVLENWARWLRFDPQEIDKERGVVIEEWRQGRGARQRIFDQQSRILLKDSRYAERIPIGKKEILEKCDYATLERFYRDWYHPELMSVVAVGDFDPGRVEALIHEHFDGMPAAPGLVRPSFEVPPHDGTLFAIATDKEESRSSVTLYRKFPNRDASTVAALRRSIVEGLFSAMLNSRYRELTERADPPFIGGSAFSGNLVRTVEAYGLGASVQNNGIERGLEALLTEAERAARFGFTAGELERAAKEMLSQVEGQYRERDKTDSGVHAQRWASYFLTGDPVPSASYVYAAHQKFLPEIQLEEVNALAREWNPDRNRAVLVSGPEKEGVHMPDEAALRGVMARVAAAELEPYADKTPAAALVTALPAPGKIVSEKSFTDLGIQRWKLSNGARVYFKSTDFKADEVLFGAWSPGGTSLASDATWNSAAAASWVVPGCGVGAFTPSDLEKMLAGKQVTVRPYIAELEEGFSGSTRPQDLETLFQLFYLYFTAPRTDPTLFQALKTRMRGVLENRASDPNTAFGDSLNLLLSQYHARSQPLTVERLEAVDLDAAYAFFKDRIADADDFTFAIVGSTTAETIRPLVERYIGGLPAMPRHDRWRDVGRRAPKGVVQRRFQRGIDDKARTAIVFTGPFAWSRKERYALQSLAEALRIRLREVLREDLGGTYGVQVSATSSRDPKPRYRVQISFACDPARMDELGSQVFAVVTALQKSGIEAEKVNEIHEIQRREYEVGLRDNDYWMRDLEFRDSYHLNLHEILEFPQLLDTLSPDLVRQAAKRYLRPDNVVQVTMLPEGAPPAKEGGTPAEKPERGMDGSE